MLLIEEILHQLIRSLSYLITGFYTFQVVDFFHQQFRSQEFGAPHNFQRHTASSLVRYFRSGPDYFGFQLRPWFLVDMEDFKILVMHYRISIRL